MSWLDLNQAPLAHTLLLNVRLYHADGVEHPLVTADPDLQICIVEMFLILSTAIFLEKMPCRKQK